MYWPYYFPVYTQPAPYFYNPFIIESIHNQVSTAQHQTQNIIEPSHPGINSENSLHQNVEKIKIVKLTLTKNELLAAGYQVGRNVWTEQQDQKLLSLTSQNLSKSNWKQIAASIPGRNQKMCYSRYRRLISSSRRKWKKQQDQLILQLINRYNFNWRKIADHFQGRSAKLLKEHYTNHLAQNVKKDYWTLEQDMLLIKLLNKQGKNWRLISSLMAGRTVTQLKNRYLGRLKRLQDAKVNKNAEKNK